MECDKLLAGLNGAPDFAAFSSRGSRSEGLRNISHNLTTHMAKWSMRY